MHGDSCAKFETRVGRAATWCRATLRSRPIPTPFSVNTLDPDCAIITDPAMLCDPLFIGALAVPLIMFCGTMKLI